MLPEYEKESYLKMLEECFWVEPSVGAKVLRQDRTRSWSMVNEG